MRTLIPRIKKSFERRGLVASLLRSALLPVHLFQEYRLAKTLARDQQRSDFDLMHGVETDGDVGGWTYLSDLNISSPNWIYGTNYAAIEPQRFFWILSSLNIDFEEFVFIDFGSGKGRALLMASEFPFRKIVGVEFSPELHAIAQRNIRTYESPQQCKSVESVCMDFTDFQLPDESCVLFFFDPCEEKVLAKTLENIKRSLQERPRAMYLIYVAPRGERLLNSGTFLVKLDTNEEYNFSLYKNA